MYQDKVHPRSKKLTDSVGFDLRSFIIFSYILQSSTALCSAERRKAVKQTNGTEGRKEIVWSELANHNRHRKQYWGDRE